MAFVDLLCQQCPALSSEQASELSEFVIALDRRSFDLGLDTLRQEMTNEGYDWAGNVYNLKQIVDALLPGESKLEKICADWISSNQSLVSLIEIIRSEYPDLVNKLEPIITEAKQEHDIITGVAGGSSNFRDTWKYQSNITPKQRTKKISIDVAETLGLAAGFWGVQRLVSVGLQSVTGDRAASFSRLNDHYGGEFPLMNTDWGEARGVYSGNRSIGKVGLEFKTWGGRLNYELHHLIPGYPLYRKYKAVNDIEAATARAPVFDADSEVGSEIFTRTSAYSTSLASVSGFSESDASMKELNRLNSSELNRNQSELSMFEDESWRSSLLNYINRYQIPRAQNPAAIKRSFDAISNEGSLDTGIARYSGFSERDASRKSWNGSDSERPFSVESLSARLGRLSLLSNPDQQVIERPFDVDSNEGTDETFSFADDPKILADSGSAFDSVLDPRREMRVAQSNLGDFDPNSSKAQSNEISQLSNDNLIDNQNTSSVVERQTDSAMREATSNIAGEAKESTERTIQGEAKVEESAFEDA